MTFKSPEIHRTPKYRAVAAWQNMNRRCLNRDGKNPAYAGVELRISKEEFVKWALPQYESILNSNPGAVPSVSRRGDIGHYEIGNIDIIPWRKHKTIAADERKKLIRPAEGRKICTKCRTEKDLVQFPKNRTIHDGYGYWCKLCAGSVIKADRAKINKRRREKRLRKILGG